MVASNHDSVLIEQVVLLASRARQATGQDPIFDMPKGQSNAWSCPIQRALNLGCKVNRERIAFKSLQEAQKVSEACYLPNRDGAQVHVPLDHPFAVFVMRFDAKNSKQLNELAL